MNPSILIGYFARPDEARKSLRRISSHGLRRVAVVHQANDGTISIIDPFVLRRALWFTVAACIGGGFAAVAWLTHHLLPFSPAISLAASLALALTGTTSTILATAFWMRRDRYGVGKTIMADHARWLMPGESVIIVQASVELLHLPMALLRETSDVSPAVFVIHQKRERRTKERASALKVPANKIQEHAERHAGEQQVDSQPQQTKKLLKRITATRRWVGQICADLTAASRLEQKTSPTADWLLDNQYILEGTSRDILVNLPWRFYRQLPILASEPYRGLPCIYGLAKDLVSHTELRVDRENLLIFINSFQSARTLTSGELWAIPQMVRIALIESIQSLAVTALADLRERQLAELWANRLIAANRRETRSTFTILAELAKAEPTPSPYFGTQLVSLLYDEAAVLVQIQSWLERSFKTPLHELTQSEQNRQTREQLSCGNAFTSLRQLALLDWREIFEKLSRVEQLLRRDPSGIYGNMDFTTRDRCRRAVEDLARASGQREDEIAHHVVKLATQASHEKAGDDRRSHVCAWLIGEERAEVARLLACRESLGFRSLAWLKLHHTAAYGTVIGSFSALFIALLAFFGMSASLGHPTILVTLVLLLVIPVSQMVIEVVNYLIIRFLPSRPLPKMDFETTGIPDEFRTLVVVPLLLVDTETIRAEVEKLEIRYLANKEKNLLFSLFTDYTDAPTLARTDDDELLQIAEGCMADLTARQAAGRFFLFHRERTWNESEQMFIGWERKRGKLEELNCLIDGSRSDAAASLVRVGTPEELVDVRFIITLDSDTQLPHGSARRLVETIAHPLNQPRFDEHGQIMPGTFTIIQPRVSPTLASTSVSIFSRLFADAVGVDPYTQVVSDVYQDLSGEGSYHGKGIYDVHAFSRVLSGKFPSDWVLSHDLIEGAHVRVGLASDIELFDDFPQGYQSYSSRAHRWIRGDWQIASWIFATVPLPTGVRGKNPLSLLNRWKILDNLRRSLLPATSIGLLLFSWLISPQIGVAASLLVGMQLLFHPLAQPFTMATSKKGLQHLELSKILHDLIRAIADGSLLPHQAAVSLDAIIRTCYRRLISHRGLLEWKAQASPWQTSRRQPLFVAGLALGSLFTIITSLMLWWLMPASLPQATPWLVLWLLSPLLGWLLNLRPASQPRDKPLPASDSRMLRLIARRTWRYFHTFVNAESSWLPPDNYQVSHQNRLAMRTSPTNIGLGLTSILAAHDFGYLTVDQVVEKINKAMASIARLERHEGHLLNWYDIENLTPLEPRYVSTVDSGNLLGALWALDQGLEELMRVPLLDHRSFAGLADTAAILLETSLKMGGGRNIHSFDQTLRHLLAPPTSVVDLLAEQQLFAPDIAALITATAADNPWAAELGNQQSAWETNTERYLYWLIILAEKSEEELVPLGPAIALAIQQIFVRCPSLHDLAHDNVYLITLLKATTTSLERNGALDAWRDRLLTAFATAQWLAGETLGLAERLLVDIRAISTGMNLGFLYDQKRKLFAIGYNVSNNRLDTSSYDLLASEARLASFIAIARGDVPLEHWFSLSRPYGAIGRLRVLLSWTGTMFEYLMPLLFQHSYPNSLLDKAARQAVAVQIAYGKARQVPWGISESAFADLDLAKTYQYRAFGVPALGLKRGLEEQLVIAPYATLLALRVTPHEALKNLKRLSALGLLGDYGYFEAMDFSRQPKRNTMPQSQKRGVIIEAYMAHHQGMAFLALTNFLHNDPFPRRFHADPRVRAYEPLLQERIPILPPLHLIATRQNEQQQLDPHLASPPGNSFTTPHTAMPISILLANGRYGVLVTNSGGGYSQWNGREISRFRFDPTCDGLGIFCYIHEAEADALWSTSYHPVGGIPEEYSVEFATDRAVFKRSDHGIVTTTEIIVSPEDDVEVRRITLINQSGRSRNLQLTSYVELSLANHNADRQHPAFNKLFIETKAQSEPQALLAFRRPRAKDDPPLFVAHCFAVLPSSDEDRPTKEWEYETDRSRFIGRGHTLVNPMGAKRPLGNSDGFVLDPIFSIRQTIHVVPGQHLQLVLVLAAGATREHVLFLVDKYRAPHAIERAMDFAWHSAQQQLQMLHIQPEDARRFQQLASYLIFPHSLLRGAVKNLEENRKGQAGLWPYGISGDLPILLVTIGETRELGLVHQILQAHTYWQMHGLATDLVILNEEIGSYERPLHERLLQLIQNHTQLGAASQAGAIFMKSAAHIPEDDLRLFKAAASVVLVAARGTLPQQLGILVESPEPLAKMIRKRGLRDPSAPLPFMELNYFNSLGGFTTDGREYAIYLGPNTNTPAPWVNVIANQNFGTLVSETGAGFSWYGNSQRNRLTGWSNDSVLDPASEAIYIRDEESGTFWSPTAAPIREETAYRARHGAGYTVFEHNSHGIEQELTVFVPVDDDSGQPIKLQRLRLRNTSLRKRKLTITYYVGLTLGENYETSRMHVMTHWDEEAQAILAQNRYHPEYGDRLTFVAINMPVDSYSGDRTAFIGRNRSLAHPVAMELVELSQRVGAGLDPCAAIRVNLELFAGERRDITCMLGQVDSLVQARQLILTYQEKQAVEDTLAKTTLWWDALLSNVEVHTPDLAADLLINRWLQYQSLSCRIWGRSAFYQSGGAFGFRDQLQDVMAFCHSRPTLARDQILLAASRQFEEGDVQHWWHPPSGAGIRSRISDDLLWLPHVVAHYVRTTGDTHILHEEIPFLHGAILADDQHEQYSTPEVTLAHATLFEHCRRALNRGLTIGDHGLPLIGTGDWNDGMNLVGAGGKGESVWLAWFLCDCLQGMAELARQMNLPELSDEYLADRQALSQRVETFAWDGAWYLRGTFDDGTPLGSSFNLEAKIDSLPQSWAKISGAARLDRATQALASAWQYLVREEEGVVLLFDPPFDTSEPSPGYIKGYPPGVRENGGQYTHGAIWMAIAMARTGDGDRAVQLLRLINPIEHARDAAAVWVYGIEPYVVAADVYRLPGRIGQGGWSWYTGSAAWLYRAWVEEIFGLTVHGDTLAIRPVIPAAWPGFTVRFRHGEALYNIQVENPEGCQHGVAWIELDGKRLHDHLILLEKCFIEHRVKVRMGSPQQKNHHPQMV